MEASQKPVAEPVGFGARLLTLILRVVLIVGIPLIAFTALYLGFIFLRDSDAPKWLMTLVAIAWGVGGVALLFWVFNFMVERLPKSWQGRLLPFVFVGPAIGILLWYLAIPTLRTFWLSLFGRDGPGRLPFSTLFSEPATYFAMLEKNFVGLDNYIAVITDRLMREAFRNNIFFWMLMATPLIIIFGLLVATLADRSRFERLAKAIVFMPMAISFVGASVIWRFVYEVRPISVPQIGLLNAIVVALGGQPQAWTASTAIAPWNNLFLVIIAVWLQAGFAMVLFSAALKGVPVETLEAARVDGASEIQTYFRIMLPQIRGTILTVTTTVIIFTLKIFDVVWVMTGGQFGTEVIGTQFYRQSFVAQNSGYGSAIAIVLLIAVIPVMIYNLKNFNEREVF